MGHEVNFSAHFDGLGVSDIVISHGIPSTSTIYQFGYSVSLISNPNEHGIVYLDLGPLGSEICHLVCEDIEFHPTIKLRLERTTYLPDIQWKRLTMPLSQSAFIKKLSACFIDNPFRYHHENNSCRHTTFRIIELLDVVMAEINS